MMKFFNSYIVSNFVKIWSQLNNKSKRRSLIILIMMLMSAIFESLSIAAIVPFLTIISEPEKIIKIPFIDYFLNYLSFNNSNNLLFFFIFLFCLVIILSGITRLLTLKLSCNFAQKIGVNLTIKAFNNILYLPYEKHIELNSSEVITAVSLYTSYLVDAILEILRLFTAFFITLALVLTAFLINWKVAIISITLFISYYLFLFFGSKNKLRKIQVVLEKTEKDQIKFLQESLGSIRNLIIDDLLDLSIQNYKLMNIESRKAKSDLTFIQISPRIYMDVLALLTVSLISIFVLNGQNNTINSITLLGSFALIGQKLLPLFQQLYSNYMGLSSVQIAIATLIRFLEINPNNPSKFIEKKKSKKSFFKKDIVLKNVSFGYKNSEKLVLDSVNISFLKGQKIGILGATGNGKSTLLDILMGLLQPRSGEFLVDGKSLNLQENFKYLQKWRSIISHVPQDVFLLDKPFNENIAIGVSKNKINRERLKWAADKAQISNFIEKKSNKYNSIVGERGNYLSGGQKQRIGLARALYKDFEVLFLDEATNALDKNTEKNITDNLDSLSKDLTIFIVAHGNAAISNCDRIIELKNGKLYEIKS